MTQLSNTQKNVLYASLIAGGLFLFTAFRRSDAIVDNVLENINVNPAGFRIGFDFPTTVFLRPSVRISNANNFPLPNVSFAGTVHYQGLQLANLLTEMPINIPANGSAELELFSSVKILDLDENKVGLSQQVKDAIKNIKDLFSRAQFVTSIVINGKVSTGVGTFDINNITVDLK